jgi:SAM-dependent methyltransferase
MRLRRVDSRGFWDQAARDNAEWYVATDFTNREAFFAKGGQETDEFLAFCGVNIGCSDIVVEIGCGVGRMTARLAELARSVIATDVSHEMLERARANLAGRDNVTFRLVPGDGTLSEVADGSADVVFSYITLQHVPNVRAQLRYFEEAARVIGPGGRVAIQIRGDGLGARSRDWAGHVNHFLRGRRTLRPEWRGARVGDEQVLAVLRSGKMDAEVRRFGVRHRWVVARRES